jgi:transposase
MNKQRRHFPDHEKVAILKRHLVDKVPVSDLCDELDIYPNQFYDWLKKFFENGHLAFANGRKSKAVEDAQLAKIQQLEAKVVRKNEVMAELMEAHTELKKILGNSDQVLGPSRHARSTRRFRPLLGRQNRHRGRAFHALDRHHPQQVPGLDPALWQGQ